ncbi:MAG: PBP1A family penicillin-binding protein [Selenomonadales bacterium]|nr:PBP1A family penicillin-binding protein [Selenomonadales bacterium]
MKRVLVLLISIGVGVYFLLAGMYALWDLPKSDTLESFRYQAATQIFDCNDTSFAKLFEQNRVPISIGEMSAYLPQAIIANEDTRFRSHLGIDPIGILRSLVRNIMAGEIVEGGSTVTQQLAREMFLTQERTMTRKLKEALLALVLEQKFSKEEIMEAYLNQVYFGEGAYGVEAAAQVYFQKSARNLNLAESALIAGLARGPHLFSPYRDMNAALQRRAEVLAGMRAIGYIGADEEQAANQETIPLFEREKREVEASYFLDYIAQKLVEKYGEERVYKGGLKVYTTLDLRMQKEAEEVLKDKEGAVLILDTTNGAIRAMVGGRSYADSQRNRVADEIRQPGSAFKPIVYAAALMQGMRTNSIVQDVQADFAGYRPRNYNNVYLGPITMKRALKDSSNVASVRLGKQVGMDAIFDLANRLGITTLSDNDRHLATVLGGMSSGVNLLELTAAYTAFGNQGIYSAPIAIRRIIDETGVIAEEGAPIQSAVLTPEIAYLMTDMLKEVLASGTGTPANLGREAGGKTGTTDGYETAWFIGYTPELTAGIFVGNDDRSPVNISGTTVAGMWGQMMSRIVKEMPQTKFVVPDTIITGVPVYYYNGKYADTVDQNTEFSAFIKGTEPKSEKKREKKEEENKARWNPLRIFGI